MAPCWLAGGGAVHVRDRDVRDRDVALNAGLLSIWNSAGDCDGAIRAEKQKQKQKQKSKQEQDEA
jgi:hypothetical protein